MSKQKSYKGKKQYAIYAIESRCEKNKKRKILKHIKSHPNDDQAIDSINKDRTFRKKSYAKNPESSLLAKMAKIEKGLINKNQYIIGSVLTKKIREASEAK